MTGLQSIARALETSSLPYPLACCALAAAFAAKALGAGSAVAASVLTGMVYALVGLPTFMNVCHDIVARNINTHVLTTVAVGCLMPLGHAMEGALLLLLFNLSHVLEDWLTAAARGNLNSLFDGVPTSATLVDVGLSGQPDSASERTVPADSVNVGQYILVKAGQEVPLDGRIVCGEAMLSTEHITGESLPRRVRPGDIVAAGAINNDGLLTVQVLELAADSTPARMARLAKEAQAKKPRVQTFLERVGAQYSKAILVGTVLIAVVLPLVSSVTYLASASGPGSFYRAAGFLTTAAPCAMLMTPLVYVSAIAAVTQKGILLKGASVLDALAACKVAALDKTGTLTTGELICTAVTDLQKTPGADGSEEYSKSAEALSVAQALSRGSMHPVATAVVESLDSYNGDALPAVELHNFMAVPGRGVVSDCALQSGVHRQVLFGSREFALEHLYSANMFSAARTLAAISPSKAGEVVSVLLQMAGGQVASMHAFHFHDRPHESSGQAIAAVRSAGLEVVMLSGDNPGSASAMADKLGLAANEVRAGLSPEAKLQEIHRLREQSQGGVLMVGDGINDAPALATADVGLAVASTPSTAAAGVADGVILTSAAGVSALPFLFSIASFTQVLVRQNIALAALAILGSALPLVLGIMPLWLGVVIHEGSTLLVALNSLRPLLHKTHSDSAASRSLQDRADEGTAVRGEDALGRLLHQRNTSGPSQAAQAA